MSGPSFRQLFVARIHQIQHIKINTQKIPKLSYSIKQADVQIENQERLFCDFQTTQTMDNANTVARKLACPQQPHV